MREVCTHERGLFLLYFWPIFTIKRDGCPLMHRVLSRVLDFSPAPCGTCPEHMLSGTCPHTRGRKLTTEVSCCQNGEQKDGRYPTAKGLYHKMTTWKALRVMHKVTELAHTSGTLPVWDIFPYSNVRLGTQFMNKKLKDWKRDKGDICSTACRW